MLLEALEAYYAEQYTALAAAEKPSKWKMNQLAEDCDTLRGVAARPTNTVTK